MKNLTVAILISVLATACVTSSKPEYKKAEVIERMEGADETPSFATGQKVIWSEGSNVYFANITTMSGNSRPEGCMKAAGLSAKAELLKHIKENITTSGQVAELNAEDDPGYESLTAFLSQGTLSGAKIESQYWEKREESEANTGERILRLKCAALVSINKSQLQKMLRDATGKPSGNSEIRTKLLEAQKSFIDGLSQEQSPAH